jgi:hypothetical protein
VRKDLLAVVTLLLAGVAIAYYLFGDNRVLFSPARGPATAAAPIEETNSPASGSESKPRSPGVTKHSPSGGLGNDAPSPDLPLSRVSSARFAPPCCELPFPTPETLRRGASAADIRAIYGDPALDVARTDGGHVTEKLYYVNEKRTQLTIAVLENGRLKAAESQPGGMLPLQAVGGSR